MAFKYEVHTELKAEACNWIYVHVGYERLGFCTTHKTSDPH